MSRARSERHRTDCELPHSYGMRQLLISKVRSVIGSLYRSHFALWQFGSGKSCISQDLDMDRLGAKPQAVRIAVSCEFSA